MLKMSDAESGDELGFLAAAKLYELGRISSGKAARLANVQRVQFLYRLAQVGVPAINLRDEEVEAEIRTARQLNSPDLVFPAQADTKSRPRRTAGGFPCTRTRDRKTQPSTICSTPCAPNSQTGQVFWGPLELKLRIHRQTASKHRCPRKPVRFANLPTCRFADLQICQFADLPIPFIRCPHPLTLPIPFPTNGGLPPLLNPLLSCHPRSRPPIRPLADSLTR